MKSIVIAKQFSYEKAPIFHNFIREILTNGGECDIMITVKIPMAEKSAITILLVKIQGFSFLVECP